MKPFSKMEAIGLKKPVVTRGGKPVAIIGEAQADIDQPIIGLIQDSDEVDTWSSDGKYFTHHNAGDSVNDLRMASEKKEGWVAFGAVAKYSGRHGLVGFSTHLFNTKLEAESSFTSANGIAPAGTQKISWEE